MAKITLDAAQIEYLVQLLKNEFDAKRIEYRRTSSHKYKEVVREEEELIKDLLEVLRTQSAEAMLV